MSEYGNILLVEDDISLAQWTKEYLEEQGFTVIHLENGNDVLSCFNSVSFDLVLLDIMLPGIDGIEVCRQLRNISSVPIIMLTARGDEFDEVIGLEVGANDYVIKPVRPRALLARIKSILRQKDKRTDTDSQVLSFGNFQIDNTSKVVKHKGVEVELSTSLFRLLWLLADNAGTVVDRETVFQQLKGREYDGLDRRFDVMVSTLRKIFNDNSQKPKKIKTVWGQGYLFVPDAWDQD